MHANNHDEKFSVWIYIVILPSNSGTHLSQENYHEKENVGYEVELRDKQFFDINDFPYLHFPLFSI